MSISRRLSALSSEQLADLVDNLINEHPDLKEVNKQTLIIFGDKINTLFSIINRIGGIMVSVPASSAVEPWSGQTKDYKIGICSFSAKHEDLRRKSKDWLAWNQDNVSEWDDMSIHGLLFQWASTIKDPVQSGPHHHLIKNYLVLAMIKLKNCWVDIKQQSLAHTCLASWIHGSKL